MYILKHMTQENGAVTTVHRIAKLTISDGGPLQLVHAAYIVLTINSFADAESKTIFWQQQIEMPLLALNSAEYPDNVFAYLTGPDGYLAGGTSHFDDPPVLVRERALRKQQVDEWRDIKIRGGAYLEGVGLLDTDDRSIRNIQGEAVIATQAAMLAEADWSTVWKLADNSNAVLSAEQTIAVGKAIRDHLTACYQRSWEAKYALEQAETVEELYAVDIISGWPEPHAPVHVDPPLEETSDED